MWNLRRSKKFTKFASPRGITSRMERNFSKKAQCSAIVFNADSNDAISPAQIMILSVVKCVLNAVPGIDDRRIQFSGRISGPHGAKK